MSSLEEQLASLRRRDYLYCQLGRERNVEQLRDHVASGSAEEQLLMEVDQLHREREWLTETFARATGRSIADVRQEMRRVVLPVGVLGEET